MKFLKDGQVIASGLLVRARKPGLQCLFPSAFKEKFKIFCLIQMPAFLEFYSILDLLNRI